jgi:hypothetical protein
VGMLLRFADLKCDGPLGRSVAPTMRSNYPPSMSWQVARSRVLDGSRFTADSSCCASRMRQRSSVRRMLFATLPSCPLDGMASPVSKRLSLTAVNSEVLFYA